MLRFFKLFSLYFLSALLLAARAHAVISPSDLVPNATYFIVINTQPLTRYYRLTVETPTGLQMMEVSGNSQEELKTSLHSQTLIPIDTEFWVEPSPRQPTSPLSDQNITAAAEMELQSKYPGSRLISIDRLGKYGRAKIIQLIPSFYSKPSDIVRSSTENPGGNYQILHHSRDLLNHETVTTIQAQMVSLSFYYGPDFAIMDYPLRPRFQRGEITLPDQFWMVDYHLPKQLDGTNLLSNLVVRLKKRHLSLSERLALNPHDGALADETFSLSHRKVQLPMTIKEEISKLESKIPEALSKLTAWQESKKAERENLKELKTQIIPPSKRLKELKSEKNELSRKIRAATRETPTDASSGDEPHITHSSLTKAKKLNEEEIELQGKIEEIKAQATRLEADIEAPLKVVFDDVITAKKRNAEHARTPKYFERLFFILLSIQLSDQPIEEVKRLRIGPIKLEDYDQKKIHFTQKVKISRRSIPETSKTNLFNSAQSEFILKIESTDEKNLILLSIDRINPGGLMDHSISFELPLPLEQSETPIIEIEPLSAGKSTERLTYTLHIIDQLIILPFHTRPELTPTLEEIIDEGGGSSARLAPTKRSFSEMEAAPR